MSRRGNNEGGIYQRTSDGRYVGAVHLGYLAGKRVRKVVYGKTRPEVSERMKKLLAEQQQGLPLTSSERLTVADFLRRWLTDTVEANVRPSTLASYRSHIEHHVIPSIGKVRLSRLNAQDVERMNKEVVDKGKSPRTAAHARAILRSALADAVKWEMIARNAAALADAPRTVEPELTTLSPGEARQFIAGVRTLREGPLYTLTLACGLRLGEVTGLAWSDIDLKKGTVRVRQTLGRLSGEFVIGEPKSRNSRRTLAVPHFALASLRMHRARRNRERLLAGPLWRDQADLVFTTSLGEPLNPSSLTRRFRATLADLKLPTMRFHDLRHSCASLLIAEGVHPRLIMETLGHSQISLTMNRYAHVAPVVQREVAGRMDGLLRARR